MDIRHFFRIFAEELATEKKLNAYQRYQKVRTMNAIVIGATGATGKDLVEQLLADKDVGQVTVFVRREMDCSHPRMRLQG